MADETVTRGSETTPTLVESSVALWPGLLAAALGGGLALGQGGGPALALAGLLALPMAAASVVGAALLRGRGEGAAATRGTVAAALAVAGPALAILGATLKANTHHKALAGVTFALVALGVVLGGLALGGRLRHLAAGRSWMLSGATALGGVVLGGLVLRGGAVRLLDVLLLVVALTLGALAPLKPSRVFGGAALGVWLLGGALGVGLTRDPGLSAKLQERSLVAAGVLVPFAGR